MTNIKLQLPKTLRNIKLRDFQKYSNIIESNPDADRDFLEIKIMEIFCGLKYKDISSLPVGIFDDATSWMMSMFENKTPLVKRFNMIGSDGVEVEFGFIPNLDKITMGEYIDLNNYFGNDTDLHKAMAVLYRPIHPSYKDKDSYRIGSYEGTSTHSDIMKDMPLDIALGARVFFLRLGTKLSSLTMSYLQSQIQEETILSEEEKKDLIANMNGIKNYTLLQAEKHLELMRLL
tara:strand:+ start:1220 stop:1915 length:696 start_codon:yes stop_codon:yes gene_type:complete